MASTQVASTHGQHAWPARMVSTQVATDPQTTLAEPSFQRLHKANSSAHAQHIGSARAAHRQRTRSALHSAEPLIVHSPGHALDFFEAHDIAILESMWLLRHAADLGVG